MNSILSRLIYGRVVFPSSKLATYELSKKFIEVRRIPVRFVTEAISTVVEWKPEFQEVYITKDSVKISFLYIIKKGQLFSIDRLFQKIAYQYLSYKTR